MGFYDRLGVRTVINGVGNGTAIGGSIMRPEVVEAMAEASRSYIRLPELLEKAGQRVAELAGVEAAYITAGAAAGVTLSVAACMTGKDNARVHQLPNTRGMKDEVIIQVMQRNYYELMIRLAGAKLVEIGLANATEDYHLESAINDQTAAIVHFVAYSPPSDLPIERVIEIGHKHGVPVVVDAAAEFPPFSALRRWADMGADLTIFSGGKGIRGPQSTGLILGKKELIEACTMNASPNHGVGRPPKVGKEEIAGVVTALELFSIEEFERAEAQGCEERARYMAEAMSRVPDVKCYVEAAPSTSSPGPGGAAPEGTPLAHVEWDANALGKTKEQVVGELADGDPAVLVSASARGIVIAPHTMQPGEEHVVSERVAEVFA